MLAEQLVERDRVARELRAQAGEVLAGAVDGAGEEEGAVPVCVADQLVVFLKDGVEGGFGEIFRHLLEGEFDLVELDGEFGEGVLGRGGVQEEAVVEAEGGRVRADDGFRHDVEGGFLREGEGDLLDALGRRGLRGLGGEVVEGVDGLGWGRHPRVVGRPGTGADGPGRGVAAGAAGGADRARPELPEDGLLGRVDQGGRLVEVDAGLLEEVGAQGGGGRERAGADLHRGGGVEVKVDEVDGLDLGDILDAVEDLDARGRAGAIPLAEVLPLDLGDGLPPLGLGVREDGNRDGDGQRQALGGPRTTEVNRSRRACGNGRASHRLAFLERLGGGGCGRGTHEAHSRAGGE